MARVVSSYCRLVVCGTVFATAGAAGCDSGGTSRQDLDDRPAAVRTTPEAIDADIEPPADPAYLVWVDPAGDAGPQTVWLERSSSSEVRGRRNGIVVAAGEHLWQWTPVGLSLEEMDCDCAAAKAGQDLSERDMTAECARGREVTSRALVSLEGNEGLSATAQIPFGPPRAFTRLQISPVASVGPYWLSRVCVEYRDCSASQTTTRCQPFAADLDQVAQTSLADISARLGGEDAQRKLDAATRQPTGAARLDELVADTHDLPAPVRDHLSQFDDPDAAGYSEVPRDAGLRRVLWGRFSRQ